jgi:hypothetical protein
VRHDTTRETPHARQDLPSIPSGATTPRDWLEQWPVALSEATAHALLDHLLLI